MVLLAEMNKIILEKYRQYQHTMQLLLNGLYGISYHLIRKIPFNGSDQARIAVMDEIHLFANMCLTASEKEARMRGKGKLTQLAMEELNLPEIDYLNKTVEILIEKILVEMNFFKEHVEPIGQSTAIEVERPPLGSFLHP